MRAGIRIAWFELTYNQTESEKAAARLGIVRVAGSAGDSPPVDRLHRRLRGTSRGPAEMECG